VSRNDLNARVDRLERELARVRTLYEKSLHYQAQDPEIALAQARKSAEAVCKQIYRQEGMEKGARPAGRMMLDDLIGSLERGRRVPRHIGIALRTIQAFGNFGTHDQGLDSEHITAEYIRPCLAALGTVVT